MRKQDKVMGSKGSGLGWGGMEWRGVRFGRAKISVIGEKRKRRASKFGPDELRELFWQRNEEICK